METTQIRLETIEKVERDGKATYWKCADADKVIYTCWDDVLAKTLSENLKKEILVVVKESGNFKNIRGFEGDAVKTEKIQESEEEAGIPVKKSRAAPERTATKLTEISKDLAIMAMQIDNELKYEVAMSACTGIVLGSYQKILKNVN